MWLVGPQHPGGRKGPLLLAAQPSRPAARDALPLGELFCCFCWLGCSLCHAPRRRKEQATLVGVALIGWSGQRGIDQLAALPGLLTSGYLNPRLRSVFSFMQALGKAGAAAAV